MAGDTPYFKPPRFRGDDFANTVDEAIVEFDLVFDVNAETAAGDVVDFSLPEMKKEADAMIDVLTAQINNMNDATFQDEISDTVTMVIVQNISDNVSKFLSGKTNKNIFKRATAFLSVEDKQSIYQNELVVHFKMERTTGIVTEELAQAIDDAYNKTKNHCCVQIAKRMTQLYRYAKQNGKGLDMIENVSIEFKSYSGFEVKPHHEEVPVEKTEEQLEEELFQELDKRFKDYATRNGWPSDTYIKNICRNYPGADPAWWGVK